MYLNNYILLPSRVGFILFSLLRYCPSTSTIILPKEIVFFGEFGCHLVSFVFCKIESEEFGRRVSAFSLESSTKEFIHFFLGWDEECRGEVRNIILRCVSCGFCQSHTIAGIASARSFFHFTCDFECFFWGGIF